MSEVADPVLGYTELVKLTRYARPGDQLRELHKRGFHRAYRARDGSVVLERPHYEAVCSGGAPSRREPQVHP